MVLFFLKNTDLPFLMLILLGLLTKKNEYKNPNTNPPMWANQATLEPWIPKFKNWYINQKINKYKADILIVKKIKKGTNTSTLALGKR